MSDEQKWVTPVDGELIGADWEYHLDGAWYKTNCVGCSIGFCRGDYRKPAPVEVPVAPVPAQVEAPTKGRTLQVNMHHYMDTDGRHWIVSSLLDPRTDKDYLPFSVSSDGTYGGAILAVSNHWRGYANGRRDFDKIDKITFRFTTEEK